MREETSKFSDLIRRLANGILVINLLIYACAAFYLYRSRNDHQKENTVAVQNLASVIEDSIAGTIEKINLSLFSVKDEVEDQLAAGGIDRALLNRSIAKIHSRIPQFAELYVTNAAGDVLYASTVFNRANLADRDYFAELRDNPKAGLVFGSPLVGRLSGVWVLNMARRLNNRDGSFAGIVVAPITVEHFQQAFSHVDVGKSGAIALRNGALELIARHPDIKGMNRKKVSGTLRELVVSGRKEATYQTRTPVDNIERLYAFHKIGDYPLYLNVGKATSEYMAGWRKESAIVSAFLLLFSLGTFIYSRALMLRWRSEIKAKEDLRGANEELENRVQERTAALSVANGQLATDLAEIRRIEAEVRAISRYTRSLIEASIDPLVTIGPDGRITDVNAATEKITGHPRAELINTDFSDYFTNPELARAGYRQVFRDGQVRDYPLEIRHRGGHTTPVLYNASLFQDENGTTIGIFAAARDITERQRLEENLRALNEELDQRVALRTAELERVNRELESFCYSISHELKAPLARLEGLSEALTESVAETDFDESRRLAERISVASRCLRSVIDNLLLITRLSHVPLHIESVDLSELARRIMAKLLDGEKERSLLVTIAPGIVAAGDRSLLTILLEQLLGNAVKYTVHTPDAKVEFGETWHSGDKACFVRDNGVGFNMAFAGKLFQPFCRLHQEDEFEGSGIGLSVAQRIIERQNGRIWAEAKEGEGATFYFNLPPPASEAFFNEPDTSFERIIDEKTAEIRATGLTAIETLAILADNNDKTAGEHLSRVRYYAGMLAQRLSQTPKFQAYLSSKPNYAEDLSSASLLHDIGKIAIPRHLLTKPGRYTPEEFEQMKIHTLVAGDILGRGNSSIVTRFGRDSYLALARDIAFYHHERWDGSGYPKGLKGEEIPLSARIVALVDTYDALRSERPYKSAWPHEKAVAAIAGERNSHFDPDVVDAFLEIQDEFKRIADMDEA
ncbi:PAS domain S-box protein [Geobacter hydrogenophilus]|nr:HD domain-containing phosphohydrolase [Geobacter hydrogenophilus]MBT0894533.1 PAS domain S-box protein [Geobacter hydrogenophilus]